MNFKLNEESDDAVTFRAAALGGLVAPGQNQALQ